MPKRSRSHVLEDESVLRFQEALPSGWVYRKKSPDYGIDGEIEIFDEEGSSTGLIFNVQLRATDDQEREQQVPLEIDEINYYESLDVPTVVVRYGSPQKSIYWQWSSNIISSVDIAEEQKTFTYKFSSDEIWNVQSHSSIRRTLEVIRSLRNYPPRQPLPLRVDNSTIDDNRRYEIDRAISRMISESDGVLVRASGSFAPVEAFVRLEPAYLSTGIDTLTGVTFDLENPSADDYVTSLAYGLVRIFRRQRLHRHAEALAKYVCGRGIAHHSDDLAFDVCMALADTPLLLVQLAILNGLHRSSSLCSILALTIYRSRHTEDRRTAIDRLFKASLSYTKQHNPGGEAAEYYSHGNFLRSVQELVGAIHHYNRARHLRPAYLKAEYFLRELAGVIFLAKHYHFSRTLYTKARKVSAETSGKLDVLLGDALLLDGLVSDAQRSFDEASSRLSEQPLLREANLKSLICEWLMQSMSGEVLPTRRSEALSILRSGEEENFEKLEYILEHLDFSNPLARFNLGVARASQGDLEQALLHFLICSIVEPNDISAWKNAAICALYSGRDDILNLILSVSLRTNGAAIYDELRVDLQTQNIASERLTELDDLALRFLEESEAVVDNNFTVRILDGESYQEMVVFADNRS